MNVKHTEHLLKRKLLTFMPSDGKTVVSATNQGVPFVTGDPKSAIAQNMRRLAKYIASGDEAHIVAATTENSGKGFFSIASEFFKIGKEDTKEKKRPVAVDKDKDELNSSTWSLS